MRESPRPGTDAEERGRWLFAQDCAFVTSAADLEGLPVARLPEVAFAGRSNVGKSSLVNALTGRRALARTSNTPGRTRQINFFRLRDALMLADLPGYGYARAAKSEIRSWTALVHAYLRGRSTLRRVCLLIDSRRGTKESDELVIQVLDAAAVSYQIVLTKCDKTKPGELARIEEATAERIARRAAAHPEIVRTSALRPDTVAALRAELASLASLGLGDSEPAAGRS